MYINNIHSSRKRCDV